MSDYAKVTAILRSECLEKVERALQDRAVSGISISRVKGYGEYADFFSGNWMSTHIRLEVITSAARADAVAQIIVSAACTGATGDGLVSIVPIDRVWRIRTRSILPPSEL